MPARPGGSISRIQQLGDALRRAWPAFLAAALVGLCSDFLAVRPATAQDEFLLNDDRVDRNQWAPRVARGATGNMVVVWMDGRNSNGGVVDFDTYLMTLRDPQAVGSTVNRRLNDDPPGVNQGFPSIAASPAGTFFCVWEDGRAGNRDVFGATLDSIGLRITPNLRLNDDTGFSEQAAPQVIEMGSSQYLVVWGDQRQGQGEIFASRLTSTGAPIGPNFKISVDPVTGGSYQGEPAAAARADGTTLVAWLDGREGGSVFGATFDVFAQLLDPNGQPVGGNFKINETTVPQRDASVSIAADPTGGFVVAWIDRRSFPTDAGDVYAQRLDANGAPLGVNVRVNDDPLGRDQRGVRALTIPGSAFLVWEDLRGNLGLDSNVEAADVPFGALPPSANFRVNVSLLGRQGTPSAVWDGRDAMLGVWEDGRNGSPDIYAISFFPDGTRRGSESQLNDDAAAGDQRRPRIGRGPGRYLATWTDRRGGTDDLYAQWLTAAGGRDGPNQMIWKADGLTRALSSEAAVASDGSALLVAHVTRDSDAGELRGFFFSAPGAVSAPSFWLTDSLPSSESLPAVVANGTEFAVVWLDTRDGGPRIYGQRFGPGGTPLGALHPVLQVEPADPVFALDLDLDPTGGYWLCYAEGAAREQRLWMTHLDANLAADRTPIAVAPSMTGERDHPSLGVGPDGRVEMAWMGVGANGFGQSYHQGFNSLGVPLGPVAALGPDDGLEVQAVPSIAVSGDRSVATWEARRDGNWSIWLQEFASGAAPASGLIRVDQDVLGADQLDPSVGFDSAGRAVVIWSDDRSPSSGLDILGRVLNFGTTAVTEPPPPAPAPEPPPPAPPRAMRVGPVAPNPFAGWIEIPVEVSSGSSERVTVRVIGVRGDLVATLHDGPLSSTRSVLRWDGRDARSKVSASGVYWIVAEMGRERRAVRVVQLR